MNLPSKFVVDQQFHRVLTFKERLKILFGYNLRADFATMVDRKRGVMAKCEIKLTKEASAEDQKRENAVREEMQHALRAEIFSDLNTAGRPVSKP